ncbi:MAG: 30S ribosome-binding factor RbfA [Planctomycetota bacterium]|nr:MAG: 30S ribosome-binding factor RbfA [Planctomycetota bacterium]
MPNNSSAAKASRKVRMESLLKREIASFIHRDLRDPRLGFLTITRVVMSGDLQLATCHYTVLGKESDRKLALIALNGARGRIINAFAPVLRTRLLPKLRFAYDEEEDRRQAMEDLIRRARASDPEQRQEDEPSQDHGDNPGAGH